MNDGSAFLILIIGVLIFFAIRDIICWYWKINARISLLEQSLDVQVRIGQLLGELVVESQEIRKELSKNNRSASHGIKVDISSMRQEGTEEI